MTAVQHCNQTVTVSLTASGKAYFSIFTSLLKDGGIKKQTVEWITRITA